MRRLQIRMDAMHANFLAFTAEFFGVLSDVFGQLGAKVHFPTYGSATPYIIHQTHHLSRRRMVMTSPPREVSLAFTF